MHTEHSQQQPMNRNGSDEWPARLQGGQRQPKRMGFVWKHLPSSFSHCFLFLMLGVGTPHSSLTDVTWAKPKLIINDSSASLEHDPSPNFFSPLYKNRKADIAASAGQETRLLRNRNPEFLEQA